MALLDYTTYDDIRAILGVSTDELEDGTISLSVYEFGLSSDIRSVSRTLVADHAIVAAIPESSWTDTQREFMEGMSLFCTFSVARQLLTSLPLFSPKELGDGKATQVRYSDNPYKEVIRRVEAGFDKYRLELEAVYAEIKSSSAAARTDRIFMIVSSPTTDPVTGA